MKKKIVALAGMLALSLLTSVAWAGKIPLPDPTAKSTVARGEIKNQGQCPDDTAFFKNVFPNLTNGPLGGSTPPTPFTIDGETVWMTVTWAGDNSFGFNIDGGVAHRVGVTVDTNRFVYNYIPLPLTPASSDADLNSYSDGTVGDDVAHLDLCLSVDPGDAVDPEVFIESTVVVFGQVIVVTTATDAGGVDSVIASIDGTTIEVECQEVNTSQYECNLDTTSLASGSYTVTVTATDTSGNTGSASVIVSVDNVAPGVTITSPDGTEPVTGTVTVSATVTDDVAVASGSVAASVYPAGDPSSAVSLVLDSAIGDVYTWSWDTEPLLAGLYTIEVSADDTSGNTGSDSVTVDVFKLLANCFGLRDAEDFPNGPDVDPYPNGCKPTPLLNVQAPPYTEVCNPDFATGPIPDFCYLSGELLLPDPGKYANAAMTYGGCDACAPDYCGDITQGQVGIPDPRLECTGSIVGGECTGVWQLKTPLQPLYVADVAVGNPDLVLGKFIYGYEGCFAAAQHTRGGASIVDLYPIWPIDDGNTPQNEATGAVFVKTDFPLDVLPPGLIAQCDVGLLSAQSGYQPVGKLLSLDTLDDGVTPAVTLAATENCVNPPRKVTRDNGYDVANIIETDGSSDLLAFKYARAQAQFDGVFAALDCARPTLLTGKFSDVSSPVNQAKAQFDNGTTQALGRAIVDLEAAAVAIREETTWQMTPENCAGDALSRIYNLSWRLETLLDAQTP